MCARFNTENRVALHNSSSLSSRTDLAPTWTPRFSSNQRNNDFYLFQKLYHPLIHQLHRAPHIESGFADINILNVPVARPTLKGKLIHAQATTSSLHQYPVCEQIWPASIDYRPKPDNLFLGYQVICRRCPDEESSEAVVFTRAKKRKLLPVIREDACSGKVKELDTLNLPSHVMSLKIYCQRQSIFFVNLSHEHTILLTYWRKTKLN